MEPQRTLLVFGGSGQTGRHLVRLALDQGYRVRALVRTPSKLPIRHDDLTVVQGSVTDEIDLDALVEGIDAVVMMLGDVTAQREHRVNTTFVEALVPAMRRHGVTRFLYQAGGLSAAPGKRLPVALRLVRNTLARGYIGQHEDNEAVMRYLDTRARDIEWIVHRAGIGSDGPSKGQLHRCRSAMSIATFVDCAAYNLRTVMDSSAVHTCDPSTYRTRT